VHGEIGASQNSRKRKTRFWFESNLEAERGLLFTALSRVYYSGLIGVVNGWNSQTYGFMVEGGHAEQNALGLAFQLGEVPARVPKPRRKTRKRK
jgi:hypothetical protein